MALTACPECGKKGVSDTAAACPNCGFNIKAYFNQKELAKQKAEEEKQKAEEKKQRDAENLAISQGLCPKCKNKLREVTYYEKWGDVYSSNGINYDEYKLTYCPSCRWEKSILTRKSDHSGPPTTAIIGRPDINTLEEKLQKEKLAKEKAEKENAERAHRAWIQQKEWENKGLCPACGGKFELFSKKCKSCGYQKPRKLSKKEQRQAAWGTYTR
jgi:ribosomal protein L37E